MGQELKWGGEDMEEEEKKSIKDSVKGEARHFFTEVKKFGREAGELAQRGGREIARVSQIGRLKGEILILRKEKDRKLKLLGERVMASQDKAALKDSEAFKIMEEVEWIEKEKKSCEEKIESLSKK